MLPLLAVGVLAMTLSLNLNGYVKDKYSPIYVEYLASFAEPVCISLEFNLLCPFSQSFFPREVCLLLIVLTLAGWSQQYSIPSLLLLSTGCMESLLRNAQS